MPNQRDPVDYVCVSCRRVFRTQFRRIKPGGNWCAPCRARHTCSQRSYGPPSEETRRKLSAARTGSRGFWKGKRFSDTHRENLRAAHIGKPSPHKGKCRIPPEVRRLHEKIHDACSGMVRRVLKIRHEQKAKKTFDYLGYTKTDLQRHIESLFLEGMSWANYGHAWVIDHVKPVAQFVREGVTDIAVINALSNLQPLWKIDNLRKGDSYESCA